MGLVCLWILTVLPSCLNSSYRYNSYLVDGHHSPDRLPLGPRVNLAECCCFFAGGTGRWGFNPCVAIFIVFLDWVSADDFILLSLVGSSEPAGRCGRVVVSEWREESRFPNARLVASQCFVTVMCAQSGGKIWVVDFVGKQYFVSSGHIRLFFLVE